MFIESPGMPLGDRYSAEEEVEACCRARAYASIREVLHANGCLVRLRALIVAMGSRFRATGRIRRAYLDSRIGKRF